MNVITRQMVSHKWDKNMWDIVEPYRTDVLKLVDRILGKGIKVDLAEIDLTNQYGILCLTLSYGRNIDARERHEIYKKASLVGMQAAIWFDRNKSYSIGTLWCRLPKKIERTFVKLETEWEQTRQKMIKS